MKIYTLYYTNTGLYNHSVFVMPNDETAIEAMKLNLMDSKAERFRNQVSEGNVELHQLCLFDEELGTAILPPQTKQCICNLKDLLNDSKRNMADAEQKKS